MTCTATLTAFAGARPIRSALRTATTARRGLKYLPATALCSRCRLFLVYSAPGCFSLWWEVPYSSERLSAQPPTDLDVPTCYWGCDMHFESLSHTSNHPARTRCVRTKWTCYLEVPRRPRKERDPFQVRLDVIDCRYTHGISKVYTKCGESASQGALSQSRCCGSYRSVFRTGLR